MEIFPAIDLQNGQCVRLARGEFGTAKVKTFAFGRLARSGLEHQIENTLAATRLTDDPSPPAQMQC